MVDIPVRQEKSAPSRPRLARSPPTGESRIVGREEIVKNDFNISPSRYIHTGAGEEYRPLAEIAQGLRDLDDEAKLTSGQLDKILSVLGV